MKRHLRKPSPAMVVACLALLVALSGASYAAVTLPRNSVGTPQLKKNAVTSPKVKDRSLRAQDFAPGQLAAGIQGPQGERGAQGPGAAKINYSAAASSSTDPTPVATVGPWTIGAVCWTLGSNSDLEVYARGPGAAQWAVMKSPDDGAATPETSGRLLDPTAFRFLAGVSAPFGPDGFNRLVLDVQLNSASDVATVSVKGLVDRRGVASGGAPMCSLYGTAVPAT